MVHRVDGILEFKDPNILVLMVFRENLDRCFPEWQGNHQGFSGIIRAKKTSGYHLPPENKINFEIREKKFSRGEKTPLNLVIQISGCYRPFPLKKNLVPRFGDL